MVGINIVLLQENTNLPTKVQEKYFPDAEETKVWEDLPPLMSVKHGGMFKRKLKSTGDIVNVLEIPMPSHMSGELPQILEQVTAEKILYMTMDDVDEYLEEIESDQHEH